MGEIARTTTPAVAPPTTVSVQPAVQPVPTSPSKIKAILIVIDICLGFVAYKNF